MRPHVKALRKAFESRVKLGELRAASNCAKCGITAEDSGRKLELHHIISLSSLEPDTSYDPNVQENLITLCHSCHQSFHRCYEKDFDGTLMEWLESVPLDEVREKLRVYQEEKLIRKEFHKRRHHSNP